MKRRLAVLQLLLAASVGAACSDDGPSVVEDACRVVVEECGHGDSVGACIDALGSQYDACLLCIADSGCAYAELCTPEAVGCALPRAYTPP